MNLFSILYYFTSEYYLLLYCIRFVIIAHTHTHTHLNILTDNYRSNSCGVLVSLLGHRIVYQNVLEYTYIYMIYTHGFPTLTNDVTIMYLSAQVRRKGVSGHRKNNKSNKQVYYHLFFVFRIPRQYRIIHLMRMPAVRHRND